MRQTHIYGYFAFGYNYGLIRRGGLENYTKNDAVDMLNSFCEHLIEFDLQVTLQIAQSLTTIKEEIEQQILDLINRKAEAEKGAAEKAATETGIGAVVEKVPLDNALLARFATEEKIDQALAKKILREIEKLDPSLDAELQLRKAYVLTKKRFGLDALSSRPQDLLANGVFQLLSDTAKKDFSLACVNIALAQPTASAFHLMRTLEQQVKTLYFAFKKTKRLEKPMWGPVIRELRVKRAPKPSEKLLDHLDSMRIHFRNPTQHPEMFYTLDEAQDLLNQTIAAINMIASEMPKL